MSSQPLVSAPRDEHRLAAIVQFSTLKAAASASQNYPQAATGARFPGERPNWSLTSCLPIFCLIMCPHVDEKVRKIE